MRLFAMRHAETTVGDTVSQRGRRQAALSAEHLKSLGFSGRIYTEPSAVCKETAAIMSSSLGKVCKIKRFFDGFLLPDLSSSRIEYKENSERVHRDMKYPFEWASTEAINKAVSDFRSSVEGIMADDRGDVLFILCTATYSSLLELYHPEVYYHTRVPNCALSLVYTDTGEQTYGYNTDHLPTELLSDNSVDYSEIISSARKAFYCGERFFEGVPREKRVLHIGDTPFCAYPAYKELIERLKPGVIIHTGDLSDEAKAGRYEQDKPR